MSKKNPIQTVVDFGQSIWLDNIQRDMLQSGELTRLIRDDGLRGITSNPTIFQKAITGSKTYDAEIAKIVAGGVRVTARDMFYRLAVEDIQAAADAFKDVYAASQGRDGMVSLEVSPDLAHDTQGTIKEARDLHRRVNRPNLMIKVPATKAGLPAIEALVADGMNVNVTLLFSVERYREVTEAYLRGLVARAARKLPINSIASVASFFVSRVDSTVDKILETQARICAGAEQQHVLDLMGKAAIANAKLAYKIYQEMFQSSRFEALRASGAQPQRLLWASTGTKNPNYSDVMYIDTLIGPDTVNTVPPATYNAFRDHGKVAATLTENPGAAAQVFEALAARHIDMKKVTDDLEAEGVKSFADSFNDLLKAIDSKMQSMQPTLSKAS